MTEAEWLACENPAPMLAFLRGRHRPRKLALFACACCRRLGHPLLDERGRRAIEAVEEYHDGKVVRQVYTTAAKAAADAISARRRDMAHNPAGRDQPLGEGVRLVALLFAAEAVCECFGESHRDVAHWCCGALRGFRTADVEGDDQSRAAGETIEAAERAAQCAILRDIFGNPFRPTTADPSWLTSTVTALARGAYEDRDFDRLPILADALQDAGCENAEILSHCRDEKATHARGCWVVDLVLGKS